MRLAYAVAWLLLVCAALPACAPSVSRPAVVGQTDAAAVEFGFPEEVADLLAPPDLTSPPDLSPPPDPLGCSGVVFCNADCGNDRACAQACVARATVAAQRLLEAIRVCVLGDQAAGVPGACPNFGGGVCDAAAHGFNAARCDQCVAAAQQDQGACFDSVFACELNCEQAAECRLDPRAQCIDHVCTI